MEMKKIEAVIFLPRLNTVRAELRRGGISGELTLTDVQQSDGSNISAERKGDGSLRQLVKLELIVGNRQAQRAVCVILQHSQTGSSEESGHISVLGVSEVFQIVAPLVGAANGVSGIPNDAYNKWVVGAFYGM
jgi:nitrogen regulatory protein PII